MLPNGRRAYVKKRLGNPVSKWGPFKHAYLLEYAGISFLYHAPDNIESDEFLSLIMDKQDLPKGAEEFVKVVPPGLKIGSTQTDSIAILGKPEQVEESDTYVWHTYNNRKNDWRKFWLRFRDGKLEMINISVRSHFRS